MRGSFLSHIIVVRFSLLAMGFTVGGIGGNGRDVL
jgi:hypothetical protein